jgi:hypothetical protein
MECPTHCLSAFSFEAIVGEEWSSHREAKVSVATIGRYIGIRGLVGGDK